MSPVSELARRLQASGDSMQPDQLAAHFPEDEVGQLASALDDYAERLTEVVQRDREFNADVSHELRTPLAVVKGAVERSEEHTSELQSLMRISYAVFCLKKKTQPPKMVVLKKSATIT